MVIISFLAQTLAVPTAPVFGALGNLLLSFDVRVEQFLTAIREPFWTYFFSAVGVLGKWHVAFIILSAVSLALWFLNKKAIIPFLVSVGGAEMSTIILKNIIMRPRPEMAAGIESSFAFPSGHATIAIALYGFLVYVLFRMCRTSKEKIIVCTIGAFLILLIGFSRLYIGVHYASDILGGYLVGALWLALGICLTEHFLARTAHSKTGRIS